MKTQWRVGVSVIGLDYAEVRAAAAPDRLDIELGPCNWGKIQALETWYLSENRKKPETEG